MAESLDMETKAKIIGDKLKQLWQKYFDPKEKKSIAVEEIVYIMEFMAAQFGTQYGHLFQSHFLGHLELFMKLSASHGNSKGTFAGCFNELTKILCESIAKDGFRHTILRRLLAAWLYCFDHTPSPHKIDSISLRNCGQFVIDARTYSMQMRMLNIICSYLRRDDDGVEKFIATFEKVEMTQGAKTAINKVLKKTSPLTYDDKHQLLELINGCLEKRSIHSIPIKSLSSMKVNAAYTREGYTGWMHLNTLANAVEICITTNEKPKKVQITRRDLQAIDLIVLTKASNTIAKFKQKLNQGGNLNVNANQSIDVTLDTAVDKNNLVMLLCQTFPKIDVKIDSKCAQDETTFCSILTNNDGISVTNFTRCGQSLGKTVLMLGNGKQPAKESTYYGDDKTQNDVVSTTRKRLSDDVKPTKDFLNASRLRSLRSAKKSKNEATTDSLLNQSDGKTASKEEIRKSSIDGSNVDIENELENIIDTAKRVLNVVKTKKQK